MTDDPRIPQPILGNGDVTAIMSLINSMLQAMEFLWVSFDSVP